VNMMPEMKATTTRRAMEILPFALIMGLLLLRICSDRQRWRQSS
jgi:hypothetical protein